MAQEKSSGSDGEGGSRSFGDFLSKRASAERAAPTVRLRGRPLSAAAAGRFLLAPEGSNVLVEGQVEDVVAFREIGATDSDFVEIEIPPNAIVRIVQISTAGAVNNMMWGPWSGFWPQSSEWKDAAWKSATYWPQPYGGGAWKDAPYWAQSAGWKDASYWAQSAGWKDAPYWAQSAGWKDAPYWAQSAGWKDAPYWAQSAGWKDAPYWAQSAGWKDAPYWAQSAGWKDAPYWSAGWKSPTYWW